MRLVGLGLLVAALVTSCGSSGGTDDGGAGDAGADASEAGATGIQTVFVIVMENHNWSDIEGSTSAPYINGTLLPMASYCENYFDNPKDVHPSEPNYIWLEAGDNLGITNDSDPASNHQATTDHLVTYLQNAGVSWRSYQEDIGGTTCPVASSGLYGAKHNPMVFFDDVAGNPPDPASANCIAHVRPYTELAGDLQNDKVAQYNFITPNLCNDMHNNTGCATSDEVKNGDTWLSAEVPKILASSAYQNGGALFITWDESENGEFPIGMIVLSPKAKGGGYKSSVKYFHSSLVRSIQEIFGVTPLLRDAANQPDLSDLFTSFP
jgi:hypothetical protein